MHVLSNRFPDFIVLRDSFFLTVLPIFVIIGKIPYSSNKYLSSLFEHDGHYLKVDMVKLNFGQYYTSVLNPIICC